MTPADIPWPTPKTDSELAALLGVSRRRIYKMRADTTPAPEDRDLLAWHTWLRATSRLAIAERLGKVLNPENAPVTAAAAPTSAPVDDDGEVKTKAHWDLMRAKEQALAAEAARRRADRESVDVTDVRRVLAKIAATTVSELSESVWRGLRPHLDGLALTHPDLLRSLRRQHDQAVIGVRATLATAIARELRALVNPEDL